MTQPLPEPIAPDEAPAAVYTELPTSGAAIAALVFSIVGLIGLLPLVGSLLALAYAHRARREATYGVAAGWEIARAARIIAWTGIVVLVVAAGAVAGYIAWGVHQGHQYSFHFGR